MQPLNKNERSRAFINFIIFFSATVLLILITAFFSVRVPFKDNERLREVKKAADGEQVFMEKFQIGLNETLLNLEHINDEDKIQMAESVDSRIIEKLNELNMMIGKDSIVNKDFYRSVVNALSFSRMAKKNERDFQGKNAEVNEWKDKYDRLDRDYKDLRDQVIRSQQSRN